MKDLVNRERAMPWNRRGILTALATCCIPMLLRGETPAKAMILELKEEFSLEVHYRDRTVRLTAEELFNALAPVPVYQEPSIGYQRPEKVLTMVGQDQ